MDRLFFLHLALASALLSTRPRAQTLVVDAGPDQVVTTLRTPVPLRMELLGQVTPPTAWVTWEQIAGRNKPSFGNAQSLQTTVSFLETGPYTLRLNATHGSLSASDTMWIHILVPRRPADNLIANPWFRSTTGGTGSMDKWTVHKGSWHATRKGHNPSPDVLGQTAADLDQRLANGQDTWIYQVVGANSLHTQLQFQIYWVTISMVRVYAKIQGSWSTTGPWTPLWTPLSVQGAHTKRWAQTAMLQTSLASGYPFYRVELHGVLPMSGGATKYTGIYFASSHPNQGPASFVPFGNGCAGSGGVPLLRAKSGGRPLLGQPFDLELLNLPTAKSILLLLGASEQNWGTVPLPLDLAFVGMPRCTLYVDAAIPLALSRPAWSVMVPNDSKLLGLAFYSQAVVGVVGNVISNAGRGILGSY